MCSGRWPRPASAVCRTGDDLAPQKRQQSGEAVPFEQLEGAEIDDVVGDPGLVEERHLREIGDQPLMLFGQQGDVQRMAAVGGVAKTDLVAEDRLPGARRAMNDIETIADEAAEQDRVEPGDPCLQPRPRGGNGRVAHARLLGEIRPVSHPV